MAAPRGPVSVVRDPLCSTDGYGCSRESDGWVACVSFDTVDLATQQWPPLLTVVALAQAGHRVYRKILEPARTPELDRMAARLVPEE